MNWVKRTAVAEKTILIVDDHPDNLRLLASMVQIAGYEAQQAQTVMAAQALIAKSHPDLILLDIKMPEMDGYTFCEMLKADPNTAYIPVIFVTALGEQVDYARVERSGALFSLKKPMKIHDLVAILNEVLG